MGMMYYNMIHNMGVEHKVDSKTGEVRSLGGFMLDLEECVLRGLVGEEELMAWGVPLPEAGGEKAKGKDEEKDEKKEKNKRIRMKYQYLNQNRLCTLFLKDSLKRVRMYGGW